MLFKMWEFAEPILAGYNNAGNTPVKLRSGRQKATTPDQDRYFRSMYFRDIFRTTTSTSSQNKRNYLPNRYQSPMDVPKYIDVIINIWHKLCSGTWPFRCGSVKEGIRRDNCTALVTVNGAINVQIYWDDTLHQHVAELIDVARCTFQHDNARLNTELVIRYVRNQNNIHVLPWPTRSADWSPTEHQRDMLEKELFLSLQC